MFTDFLAPALPLPPTTGGFAGSAAASVIVALVSLAGIYLAYLFFGRRPALGAALAARPGFRRLAALALAGWGFDRLYDARLRPAVPVAGPARQR